MPFISKYKILIISIIPAIVFFIYSGIYRIGAHYGYIKVIPDYRQYFFKVTIPEGTSAEDIAFIFLKKNQDFDAPLFVSLAKKDEGYLFPDTYVISSSTSPAKIVKMMEENFNQKIKTVENEMRAFGKPLKDVVIMASILEEEARTLETRRMISGILWKRIKEGIPLQVDVTFPYIKGYNNGYVTIEDTKIDSPYNTYKNKGLPLGPITNPGLDSILAAITPVSSPYYFYLADKEGNIHYARTHDEHIINRQKYLK